MNCEIRSGGIFAAATAPLAGACVLQVIPALDAGGAERTTVDIAEAITAAGGRAPEGQPQDQA